MIIKSCMAFLAMAVMPCISIAAHQYCQVDENIVCAKAIDPFVEDPYKDKDCSCVKKARACDMFRDLLGAEVRFRSGQAGRIGAGGIDKISDSATQGCDDARFWMAEYYENDGNTDMARFWLKSAVANGHAPSQYMLAMYFAEDDSFGVDLERSAELLRAAISGGFAPAVEALEEVELELEKNKEHESAVTQDDGFYDTEPGMDMGLEVVGKKLVEAGFSLPYEPFRGRLRNGESVRIRFVTKQGYKYAVVGGHDEFTNGVTLSVLEPNGRIVGSSFVSQLGDETVTAGKAGSLIAEVTMQGCRAADCSFGFHIALGPDMSSAYADQKRRVLGKVIMDIMGAAATIHNALPDQGTRGNCRQELRYRGDGAGGWQATHSEEVCPN